MLSSSRISAFIGAAAHDSCSYIYVSLYTPARDVIARAPNDRTRVRIRQRRAYSAVLAPRTMSAIRSMSCAIVKSVVSMTTAFPDASSGSHCFASISSRHFR